MTQQSQTMMWGGNAAFIEELYEAYLQDPQSVDAEWRSYFDEVRGETHETRHSAVQQKFLELGTQRRHTVTEAPATDGGVSGAQQAASALVTAYRVYGHICARTNPLKLRGIPVIPELQPEYYGLNTADLKSYVQEGPFEGSLQSVIAQLKETYCGAIGFEYNYLPARERQWFQEHIEKARGHGRHTFSAEERRRLFWKLNAAEGLELYLKNKYPGVKRFGLEGGESFIPLLDRIIQKAGTVGVHEVVIGMAHRGRLNTLVNIFGKPPSVLFDEFDGKRKISDNPDVAGDVKYHMGYSSDIHTPGGAMHLALAFNPSHLEIVSPVVHGSVRARQDRRGDTERKEVLPITVHGDAAVSGQGVVMETLNLSRLRGFATGGAIRIVINNQVGFTISDPRDTRSSRYCTDVAKIANAPVLHVNGDDPEAVAFCGDLAVAYRQEFGKDVFIDLICFRRNGHNEGDEPRMTQPIMYREIDQHPGTRALYAKYLEQEGLLKPGEADEMVTKFRDLLDRGETVVEEVENLAQSKLAVDWSSYTNTHWTDDTKTAVPQDKLTELGLKLASVPEGFKVHRTIDRTVIKPREAMAKGEQPLDWGMGEMLAYASLLDEGFNVRLVGQDSGRGTFVHRHAVLHDQDAADPMTEEYMALAHLSENQGRVEVVDSTLSEEAVMAFEYGYSTSEPKALIAWEGQFGDFANGAQAVIDQFLSAGESKWQRLSGLTLLLPHGYEGAGPEHSSARLERYLQLCAQKNMQVVVPSSAAQIFHLLRRQVLRPYRKPLIVMTPKSLLRNKQAMSPLSELVVGRFQEVIGDTKVQQNARRVIFSSGKLHWELVEAHNDNVADYPDTALIRLEQLYPFPTEQVKAELARHPNAEVVWAQEEPENQGAWLMIWEDLENCLAPGQQLSHASRPRSASTAAGYTSVHVKEQAAVIAAALGEPVTDTMIEGEKAVSAQARQQG